MFEERRKLLLDQCREAMENDNQKPARCSRHRSGTNLLRQKDETMTKEFFKHANVVVNYVFKDGRALRYWFAIDGVEFDVRDLQEAMNWNYGMDNYCDAAEAIREAIDRKLIGTREPQ